MSEVEWISAGYVRSKRTGRWHAVMKYDDEMVVSENSFETREEVLMYLKQIAERCGGHYRPIQ
jgi:hypothetical protein